VLARVPHSSIPNENQATRNPARFVPADYHTHTPLCRHATGSPEEYVAAALAAGLTEYGISDHAPARPEPFDDWRMLESDLPAYFEWIDRARAAAGSLPVRAGLECDWLPGCEGWIENLAGRYPWDYLIGSVHYLGSWDFDNPKWLGRWAESDVDQIWTLYWEAYAGMARSQLFEILGHPDLVKKFSHRPEGDLDRFYEPAIAAIARSGCAIELNTAGWHKPCAEAYPHPRFLELACTAGIPLVISSDAHAPGEVARDFPKAIQCARSAGYRETLRFRERARTTEPLGESIN
jgi:histidinol-phosphatase (PHP family)